MGSDQAILTSKDGEETLVTIRAGRNTVLFRSSLAAMFAFGLSYVTLWSDAHNDARYIKRSEHDAGTNRLEKSLEEGRAELRKLSDDFNQFARNKQASLKIEQLKFNP